MARKFFYVCAGLLCLAVAYHFGAQSATAQAPDNPVVAATETYAYTTKGDVYHSPDNGFTWERRGNVFSGPTPAKQETMGSLKARYR